MPIWRYILNRCKNMSGATASLAAAVLVITATSLWAGSLIIGSVLTLVIIFAVLATFPLWGTLLALASTLWHMGKTKNAQ